MFRISRSLALVLFGTSFVVCLGVLPGMRSQVPLPDWRPKGRDQPLVGS